MDTSRPSSSQQIEIPPDEILARLTEGDREQLLDAIAVRHFRVQRDRFVLQSAHRRGQAGRLSDVR